MFNFGYTIEGHGIKFNIRRTEEIGWKIWFWVFASGDENYVTQVDFTTSSTFDIEQDNIVE